MAPGFYYSRVGPMRVVSKGPAVLILHGLFGSGRNWRGVAEGLSRQHDLTVYLADLPNHGRTFLEAQSGQPVDMTWTGMAASLKDLLGSLRGHHDRLALMGHSLGGQVAMQASFLLPPGLFDRLVVVDVAPRPLKWAGSQMERLLDAMLQFGQADQPIRTRAEAKRALAEKEPDKIIVDFLLTNGSIDPSSRNFHFNIPLLALKAGLLYLQDTYDGVPRARPVSTPALFVGGARSDFIDEAKGDYGLIRALFPASQILKIEGAGHWPHFDNSAAFIKAVGPFIAHQ